MANILQMLSKESIVEMKKKILALNFVILISPASLISANTLKIKKKNLKKFKEKKKKSFVTMKKETNIQVKLVY